MFSFVGTQYVFCCIVDISVLQMISVDDSQFSGPFPGNAHQRM